MKFTGYRAGWNRCECGQTLLLRKESGVLYHRPGRKPLHDLVMQKKAEARARSEA